VSDRTRTVRNVVILLLLAAAVWRLPGGAVGERTVSNLVAIVFWGGLIFFIYRLYMERRTTLLGWDDRLRFRLYASVGVMMFAIVATNRMFGLGSLGALAWFMLLGVAVWGIFTALRAARSY
jgi:hypothetical protein